MFTRPNWERTDDEKKMSAALEKVAKEVGTEHITAVAIAYIMQRTPYVFPIIGGRKVEHLKANLEALKISLSQEQIDYLESIIPFSPGFPTTFIVSAIFRISSKLIVLAGKRIWGWPSAAASCRNRRLSDSCAVNSSTALKVFSESLNSM